jgi:hypothetical protein
MMMEWIDETFDLVIVPDGFEHCIMGVVELQSGVPVAVLNVSMILETLVKDDMTYDEAQEYFEFNMLGAYVGEGTPLYMYTPEFESH